MPDCGIGDICNNDSSNGKVSSIGSSSQAQDCSSCPTQEKRENEKYSMKLKLLAWFKKFRLQVTMLFFGVISAAGVAASDAIIEKYVPDFLLEKVESVVDSVLPMNDRDTIVYRLRLEEYHSDGIERHHAVVLPASECKKENGGRELRRLGRPFNGTLEAVCRASGKLTVTLLGDNGAKEVLYQGRPSAQQVKSATKGASDAFPAGEQLVFIYSAY